MHVIPAHRHHRNAHQRGVSLVELMVALAIGLFLVLGLVQIFSATRLAFAANEGLARVQENSRFAVEFLREDLRMAGHMGCLNELGYRGRAHNHVLTSPTPTNGQWPYRLDYPVQVYEFTGTGPGATVTLGTTRSTPAGNSWSPALPTQIAGTALNLSDVVVVRYLSADFVPIAGINYATGSETLSVAAADAAYVTNGGIYGVTDCKNISLFQIRSGGAVSQGGLNIRGWTAAENAYGQFNMLHQYRFAAYFVANNGAGEPGLYRRELQADGNLGNAQEVVPGVESLQVVLGVNAQLRGRTEGDTPSNYVTGANVQAGNGITWATPSACVPIPPAATCTAAQVTEQAQAQRWASVVNFRVGMLIRGPQGAGIPQPENNPSVADTRVELPDDGRMRQTYETQITIRNRIRG